jgi:multidrug transporter EmrE-like cation transporter
MTSATPLMLSHGGWWGGVACYVASVLIWVLALSRAPVSIIYPMLSLGYIVNAVGAMLLFGEPFSAVKLAGIATIILGVWMLAGSRA